MKQAFIIILFIILFFSNSHAHPHTFIEVEPTVSIENKSINKLHIKWTLDEMTSMLLIMELDIDANGKFDKEENTYIYENYFSSLSEQNFYMQILSNQKNIEINPTNFKASIKNNRLIYAFDIEQKIQTKNLKVDFFDETLFVGLIIEKDYITVNGIQQEQTNKIKKEIFGVK